MITPVLFFMILWYDTTMKTQSSKNNRSQLILEGPMLKALLLLAMPILANNLIGTLYTLGDTYWVSRLGDVPVAAINFVWPVTFLTLSVAIGVSLAGGTIIAQHIGGGNPKKAQETAQQLYIFGIIFGIIAGLVGWFATPSILTWMNAPGALYTNSVVYLRILFIEMPFMFMMNIFFSINQAQGNTLRPTIVNGSSAVFNIILDPLFIFTFGLGIQGAAIATVLSKVPFALYGIYRMSHNTDIVHINPFDFKIHGKKMRQLIQIGFPASLGNSGVALGFIVLHSIIVDYGEFAVTALGIGNRINGLLFMPAQGIGAALATIVGQNLGANNIKRIKQAFYTALALSLTIVISMSIPVFIFSKQLVGIFSDTTEVLAMGSHYLRALSSTTWTFCFFYGSTGLFNGSGHTKYSMVIEAGRLWVFRLPLILLMANFTLLLEVGVWYSVGLSNLLAAMTAYALTFTGVWKHSKLSH